MRLKIQKYLVLITIVLMSNMMFAQHDIPEDFCISNDELRLFILINEHRKANNKSEIPLSRSLSYVAKLHVNDLHYNRPDAGDCNLHSWSNQGDWTECCYGRDIFNNTCMTSKPKELTNYPGFGYEIAFWESVDAIPEIVLDLWTAADASNDLILSRNIWKEKEWKSLGVGILKGYAVVWFGAESDIYEGVKICDESETVSRLLERVRPSDNKKTDQQEFHLIIASHKDMESAQKEVNNYKQRGFRNPSVVVSGDNFRVSLGSYPTYDDAMNAKKRLHERYSKAWILKQ